MIFALCFHLLKAARIAKEWQRKGFDIVTLGGVGGEGGGGEEGRGLGGEEGEGMEEGGGVGRGGAGIVGARRFLVHLTSVNEEERKVKGLAQKRKAGDSGPPKKKYCSLCVCVYMSTCENVRTGFGGAGVCIGWFVSVGVVLLTPVFSHLTPLSSHQSVDLLTPSRTCLLTELKP